MGKWLVKQGKSEKQNVKQFCSSSFEEMNTVANVIKVNDSKLPTLDS